MTTHQSMDAIAGTIITPAEHAVLGAQLGGAGFSDAEVSNLLAMIERNVAEEAMRGARTVALSVVSTMVNILVRTHQQAAMEIHRQLSNQTGGLGGVSLHRRCAHIALTVANSTPSHIPVAATPIIGSVR